MKDINKSLNSWLEELNQFELTQYEKLPDIDLYMDQVITYLERQLMTFSLSSMDKLITSSMINNYVKGEVIPAPNAKRYNKEHIALILEVCLLKKVLSISNIKEILDASYKDEDFTKTYNKFVTDVATSLHEVSDLAKDKLDNIDTNDQKALLNLALSLGLKANAYILVAERIIDYIRIHNDLAGINTEKTPTEE